MTHPGPSRRRSECTPFPEYSGKEHTGVSPRRWHARCLLLAVQRNLSCVLFCSSPLCAALSPKSEFVVVESAHSTGSDSGAEDLNVKRRRDKIGVSSLELSIVACRAANPSPPG